MRVITDSLIPKFSEQWNHRVKFRFTLLRIPLIVDNPNHMPTSTLPQSSSASGSNLPKILESRTQYRSCHICLPDDEQRMAAIFVERKYYSLIKVCKEFQPAEAMCSRLLSNGQDALITAIAKGFAVWRFEPEAIVDPSRRRRPEGNSVQQTPTCKILTLTTQYQSCLIRVPDLDDRCQAVLVEGKYYGLFKAVENRQQALEIAARLGRRGDATVITKTEQGEAVWVLEPEARQED
jgi:hypothetical protein